MAATLAYIQIFIMRTGVDPGDDPWIFVFLIMLFFPLSFGIAIIRFRLFDIDRIVSRTVSYTLIAAFLALVYAAGVAAVSTLTPSGDDLAVAASTLAAAALFNPVRTRIQRAVERRFNRSHYDAEAIATSFIGEIRDETNPENVIAGFVDVVGRTLQPQELSVWVRQPMSDTA